MKVRSLIKRERSWAVMLSALLLVSLLALAYFFITAPAVPSPYSISADEINPEITSVKSGSIKKILLIDGELRAVTSRTVFVSTSEESKITFLPPEGSIVKAGDRVVELDSSAIHTKIKEAEEQIIAAENKIVQSRSTHESFLRDMEVVLSQLWLAYEQAKIKARAPAEVIPRRDYQENMLGLEKARTEYENQLRKIEQKKKEQAAEIQVETIDKDKLILQLKKYKSNLAGMTLTAPAEGMVIYSDHWNEQRKVQIGDVLWGGFPVITLPDLQQMEVTAAVNEVDGPKLSIGQKATIRLDSYPHIEITGSVKSIAQTAVKASWRAKAKIFKVVIAMDKTVQEIMKPGMSAQVSIIISDSNSKLVIPRSTVGFENDSPCVLRLEGENNRAIAITILSSDPFNYAIADNGALKEGDRILSRWPSNQGEGAKTN